MSAPIPVAYKEQRYSGIAAAARALGISADSLYLRWKKAGRPGEITDAMLLGPAPCRTRAKSASPGRKAACPISRGLPTRMSQKGFAVACARYREEAGRQESPLSGHGDSTRLWVKQLDSFVGRACRQCGGKVPAEIEIISIREKQGMSPEPVQCEVCGAVKNCRMNHGKMRCNSCVICLALARYHPGTVLRLLREAQGEDYLSKTLEVPAVHLAENPEQAAELERLRKRAKELEERCTGHIERQEEYAVCQRALQESQAEATALAAHIAELQQKINDQRPSTALRDGALDAQEVHSRDALLALLCQNILSGKVSLVWHKDAKV